MLYGLNTFGRHLGRIRLYGQAIEAYRAGGLGRPDVLPAPLRDELAASVALVVGNGVSALDLAPGRTRSTTTRRPARRTPTCSAPCSSSSSRRAGSDRQRRHVAVPAARGSARVPQRGLLKADRIELVATRTGPDQRALLPVPLVADLDYVADMLRPHFTVAVATYDTATVITLR
ncbi:hypothetical protein QTS76_37175 [Micromonospora sp. b486]|uniref:hypothetical protein n=1 Tax=Micromonospora sp. WMMB482 TaxID=2849653 RepID=UPI0020B1B58A|nr:MULTISPECIES: hypothetical protein [unclassified Micromonospora]MDM4784677.1 hypothetical protein [Micromonospora sp. b486]